MSDDRRYAPATLRNPDFILGGLLTIEVFEGGLPRLLSELMVGDEVWGVLGLAGLVRSSRGAEGPPADRAEIGPSQFCFMRTRARFMFMAVTTNRRW
jgi:hypothetical protein